MKRKAFTLVELMVAMGILAIIIAMAGVIFKAGIRSHRMAGANADVLRKFRLVTQQLDADFQGLRSEGEIFVAWVWDPNTDQHFDRMMFYSIGDFASYGDTAVTQGQLARICYMLGRRHGLAAPDQMDADRILARSQHIYRHGSSPYLTEVSDANMSDWFTWQNDQDWQHDPNTLQDWLKMERDAKIRALWAITDVNVKDGRLDGGYGTEVDPNDPEYLHAVLCEGVGEFRIQSWYAPEQRWIPEALHTYTESAGMSSAERAWLEPVRWLWYPYRSSINDQPQEAYHLDKEDLTDPTYQAVVYDDSDVTPENVGSIPGLGRALKFTFTLYDSQGLLEQGRIFTHIIQLD